LRNDRSLAAIGGEPRTPIDDAVRATLVGGCLAALDADEPGAGSDPQS
jgi:hypothetical protein